MRGLPSVRTCPSNVGGKNWEPSAYNPELNLMFIPSIEGCNTIETLEQRDMQDQGGPAKVRERFTGGSAKTVQRLYGSLKAIDPVTGETKASLKMTYPNYGGALATAGNLVFIGEPDGTFGAYDAKSLQQLWSFNTGTGINAPPITYAVNGKQFIAVLAGSRQNVNIYGLAPEIKNMAPASMLYVFAL